MVDTMAVLGIDHVLASGAVDGRATTHEWGRPSLRDECVVARPTTAPDGKRGPFL